MRELYHYHELEDMYEDMLNECYEDVTICGYTYNQGHALRNIDPIAFRCGVSEWESEEFVEVTFEDMTEEERKHYYADPHTIMWARGV